MNKTLLIQAISDVLRENFEKLQSSSRKTRSAGSDPESKAEGKYDTRSTEENYLADGFAKQAVGVMEIAAACENMVLLSFDAKTPIDLSALVEVEFPAEKILFFLAPAGGGMEVICEGKTVTLLTPESPLGAQLLGLKVGGKTKSPKTKILSVE